MVPLDFPVALGIVGASSHVAHAADAYEVLELLGDELGTVVTDDPGGGTLRR